MTTHVRQEPASPMPSETVGNQDYTSMPDRPAVQTSSRIPTDRSLVRPSLRYWTCLPVFPYETLRVKVKARLLMLGRGRVWNR
jgi:hypothetical protein